MRFLWACFFLPLCASCVDLSVDVLFWQPAHGGIDFAYTGVNRSGRLDSGYADYHLRKICPAASFGVRVSAGIAACAHFSIHGLYLPNAKSAKLRREMIFPLIPIASPAGNIEYAFQGDIRARLFTQYGRCDLRMDAPLFCCEGVDLQIAGLIRYSYIEEKLAIEMSNFPTLGAMNPTQSLVFVRSHRDLSSWGIGPGIGLEGEICFWRALSIVAQVNGVLLIGERKATEQVNFVEAINLALNVSVAQRWVDPSRLALVPAFDGRLGLSFMACWYNLSEVMEFGYEFTYAYRAFKGATAGVSGISPANQGEAPYRDMAFSGPYLSLEVQF